MMTLISYMRLSSVPYFVIDLLNSLSFIFMSGLLYAPSRLLVFHFLVCNMTIVL
jgi:hypothetical protein